MHEYLILLLINELMILGIWNLAEPDMLLGPLAKRLDKVLPELVRKPIYDCPPCMSSVWGLCVWTLFFGFPSTLHEAATMCVYILALSGLSKVVVATVLK